MAKTDYRVKNLVTGFEYKLPKEDCDRLVLEEPHNFKVIDKDYKAPEVEEKSVSTFNKVVVEVSNRKKDDTENANPENKPLENYSYKEIFEYCKKNELSTKGKKEELITRAIEALKTTTETETTEEAEETEETTEE